MCKINFKKTLPYIGSILFMIILSYIYFSPDILEGKVLFQGDTQQSVRKEKLSVKQPEKRHVGPIRFFQECLISKFHPVMPIITGWDKSEEYITSDYNLRHHSYSL